MADGMRFHDVRNRDVLGDASVAAVPGTLAWLDGQLGIESDNPWDCLPDVSPPKKIVSKIRLCNNFRVRGVCVGMCFKNPCEFAHDLWDLDVGICHRNGDNDVYMPSTLTDYEERLKVFLEYYVTLLDDCDKPYFSDIIVLRGYLSGLIDQLVVFDRLVHLFVKYFSGDSDSLSWMLYLVAIARSGSRKCVFEQLVSSEFVYDAFSPLIQSMRSDKYAWSIIKDAGPLYVNAFPDHVSCVKRLLRQ